MSDGTQGYDILDEIGGGKYLSLKKKDDEVRVRVVSDAVHSVRHWLEDATGKNSPVPCTGKNCKWCGDGVENPLKKDYKFGWIVIDRADGQVKVFTGPKSIAFHLRDLINDEDFGNPLNYDIKVKRTEDPGANYYKVTPLMQYSEPVSDEEKVLIKEANIDLSKELSDSTPSQSLGNYSDLEDAPEEEKIDVTETMEKESAEVKEADEDDDSSDLPF